MEENGKMESGRGRKWLRVLWKTLGTLAAGAVLYAVLVMAGVLIAFGTVHWGFYLPCLLAGSLGLFLVLLGAIWGWRGVRRTGGVVLAGAILVSAGYALWWKWEDIRYARVPETGTVDWQRYQPFREGNRLPKCDAPEEFRFRDGGPKLRAAYALYPIAAAAVQALGSAGDYAAWTRLTYGGSDDLFDWLVRDPRRGWQQADAVFGLEPSDGQKAAFVSRGADLRLQPVARDAFVFFVHADNPARNLTTDQVRAIYSGQATTWREAGVDWDAPLMPFQRNKNSGSQTTLERIMGDIPIMPPMEEDRLGGMGDIFRDVADYRNRRGAIGFSFRYYATELVAAGKIRLLALDGVEPTVENIRNGRYPFIADSYLVTAGAPEGDTSRLAAFLSSPEGRALVEAVGYVAPGEIAAAEDGE